MLECVIKDISFTFTAISFFTFMYTQKDVKCLLFVSSHFAPSFLFFAKKKK